MNGCPCGSEATFEACCEPFLRGTRKPETAEATMRARYTAHTTGDIPFITATLHPEALEGHDEETTRQWAEESAWIGLEIRGTDAGGPDDDEGHVEFIASYRDKSGQLFNHHELSQFLKVDGEWRFRDATSPQQQQIRRDAPKVGRNDPCACGSGKKHKKCCGKAA